MHVVFSIHGFKAFGQTQFNYFIVILYGRDKTANFISRWNFLKLTLFLINFSISSQKLVGTTPYWRFRIYHNSESYMYTFKPEIINQNFKPKIRNQPIWFFPLSRATVSSQNLSPVPYWNWERIVLSCSSRSKIFHPKRIVHMIMGFTQKLHNLLHCGIAYHNIFKICKCFCFSKIIDIAFDQMHTCKHM